MGYTLALRGCDGSLRGVDPWGDHRMGYTLAWRGCDDSVRAVDPWEIIARGIHWSTGDAIISRGV